MSAALKAPYGEGAVKLMSRPETEDMVIMLPFVASRCGKAAWINDTVPWISVL